MSESGQSAQLQQMIDKALLGEQEWCVHNLLNGIKLQAHQEGVQYNHRVALSYFWELARTGMVAVPGDTLSVGQGLYLTDRGRRLLEKGEHSPHNPSKYLAALRKRVAEPNDVAMTYLEEAAEAWRCGLYRSSAVMLGCACERLVLLIAEAIAKDGTLPGAGKIGKAIEGRVFVSSLFEEIRSTLMNLKESKKLPKELGDALDRKLSAIFDHARGLRNQSGHPTEAEVSAEDAEAGLLLFPGFYELVDKLIAQLAKERPASK